MVGANRRALGRPIALDTDAKPDREPNVWALASADLDPDQIL